MKKMMILFLAMILCLSSTLTAGAATKLKIPKKPKKGHVLVLNYEDIVKFNKLYCTLDKNACDFMYAIEGSLYIKKKEKIKFKNIWGKTAPEGWANSGTAKVQTVFKTKIKSKQKGTPYDKVMELNAFQIEYDYFFGHYKDDYDRVYGEVNTVIASSFYFIDEKGKMTSFDEEDTKENRAFFKKKGKKRIIQLCECKNEKNSQCTLHAWEYPIEVI